MLFMKGKQQVSVTKIEYQRGRTLVWGTSSGAELILAGAEGGTRAQRIDQIKADLSTRGIDYSSLGI